MADLKPCPFCGAHDGIGYGYARDGASLCCGSCGVGFIRHHAKGGYLETQARLAEAWNTRTTDATLTAISEATSLASAQRMARAAIREGK